MILNFPPPRKPRKKTDKPKEFMPSCYLSWEEMRALEGLSELSFRTYVVLRGYMEPNRELGCDRTVSLSLIRSHMEVDGGRGKRSRCPTIGQVQFCIEKLGEKGLLNLDKYNPHNTKKLILFFPLADEYVVE